MNKKDILDLPFGSVLKYRKQVYFLSKGLDAPILTDTDGHWYFVSEIKWKTFQVVFKP